MSLTQSFMILLSRIFIGALFIYFGILKGGDWHHSIDYLISMGVPGPQILIAATIVCDFLGGLFLILGFKTRFGAWLLVISLVFSLLIMSGNWRDQNDALTHILSNLAVGGGCLALIILGPGAMSVDAR
jgi:putative oxidoreductase